MLKQVALAAVCVLGWSGVAVPAWAQEASPNAETAGPAAGIDASKLPVDIARIRRQLVRVTVREERDGLNLRYLVDVFAQAPAIELFPSARLDPNYWTGPAPYGAPAHRDFLNLWTPQGHRREERADICRRPLGS